MMHDLVKVTAKVLFSCNKAGCAPWLYFCSEDSQENCKRHDNDGSRLILKISEHFLRSSIQDSSHARDTVDKGQEVHSLLPAAQLHSSGPALRTPCHRRGRLCRNKITKFV